MAASMVEQAEEGASRAPVVGAAGHVLDVVGRGDTVGAIVHAGGRVRGGVEGRGHTRGILRGSGDRVGLCVRITRPLSLEEPL